MDKSKENDEKIELGASDFITELMQEADKVIAEAGEKAGREAEQELDRIISEYERKTKQIILKIREETKTKTAEIAGKLSEAILLRIEQASAEAVTSAVSKLSSRAWELTRKVQETAQKETDQEISKVSTGLWDNTESTDKNAQQEETDIARVKEEDSRQESKPVIEEEGMKLHQSIEAEDFDRWLIQ
jgi:nitrogenase molybdenum-iron protein alpha/beta subunit